MFFENQENEHQNGIHIWNVSELYMEIGSVMSKGMASVSGAPLNCIGKLGCLMTNSCKTASWEERNLCRFASAGQVDDCPVWFQVLISDLRKKDSLPGLLQVLIFNLFM